MSTPETPDDGFGARAAPTSVDPSASAPASTGAVLEVADFLGKVPMVVVFVHSLDDAAVIETVRGFDEHLVDFGHTPAQALVVAPADMTEITRFRTDLAGNTPVVADFAASWQQAFSVELGRPEDGATCVIVDRAGGSILHERRTLGGTLAEELLTALTDLDHL